MRATGSVFVLAVGAMAALGCDRSERASDEPVERAGDVASARGEAPPEGGLVKIVLQPDEAGVAPIELLLEIEPPAASDAWVEPLASRVSDALGGCDASRGDPAVDVVLSLRGGSILGGHGDGELATCVSAELAGAEVAQLGDEPRRIRLRTGELAP